MYYEKYCYVWVEFVDDENVRGNKYWYLSKFENAEAGDKVIAPLGRHNGLQEGIVREVRFDTEYNSPFPFYLIKSVKQLIKSTGEKYV